MRPETAQRRPSHDIPDHSHGLWSLWDMRPYEAWHLLDLVAFMERMVVHGEHEKDRGQISIGIREDAIAEFEAVQRVFTDLGLAGSVATIEKIVDLLKIPTSTYPEQAKLFEELKGRIIDEKKKRKFFALTLKETELYIKPTLGWEPIVRRFPGILNDLEEASKCVAFSRYAAAVFHSTQIVENGLIELGTFLNVNDPISGWTAVSKKLKAIVDKSHKDRSIFERKNFPFLEQVQGTVESLKNSWRNKISHSRGRLVLMTTDFSPEIADEIFMATRSLMRRLADDLPPPKKKSIRAAV